MFDLVFGLQQVVEGGAQIEVKIMGSRPIFRDFWVLGYVTGMGMSTHGFTHV
jgi:hypothetical protein